MNKNVPDAFQDLLEIATYVYSADQAIKREDDVDSFGNNWCRDLHFLIPVRNSGFWNGPEIQQALRSTLGFVSDDEYHFEFCKLKDAPSFQGYLNFNDDGRSFGYPKQVVMFSGGLDSLAGAVDEVLNGKRKVVLVTHKSTPKLNNRHRRLEKMIADRAGENTPLHIGVRVNKNKELNYEYTQRSRSFLYVSIGATIASMLDLKSVRFYENGVISLNLPVCAQVVGSKATRTTHPRVIQGFQKIISLVAGEPFTIENPYIWKTKADVVEVITKAGCQDMIAASTTCTHTWEMTKDRTHCGTCSQCIDRRFAMIAAKADQYDPVEAYKTDIFTQGRNKDEDKIMAASYLERANQVCNQDDIAQFMARFSEVSRVFRYMDENPGSVAQKVYDLYRRHAKEVCDAMKTMIARNITAILQRTLPGDCLLRTMYESGSVISVPAVELTIEQPANYFRRRGDVWEVRFNKGEPIKLVTANKGSQYLSYLLSHPNQPIPVAELVCGSFYDPSSGIFSAAEIDGDDIEDGYQITQGIPLNDAGVIIDAKAREQYRERVSELFQEIDEARDSGDEEKVEQLQNEMTVIACALNGSKARGGKPRTLGDKRKNVKDSFRIAVKRAIEKISEYDSPLGQHLDSSIKFGNEPVYLTEEEIVWEVRPIVNE